MKDPAVVNGSDQTIAQAIAQTNGHSIGQHAAPARPLAEPQSQTIISPVKQRLPSKQHFPSKQHLPSIEWSSIVLPLLAALVVVLFWSLLSHTVSPDLPSPIRTWQESKRYVLEPLFKDGEMSQGIGRLAAYSLFRVMKGYALALLIGTPLGFLIGLSKYASRALDPLIQILRPISPLAWLPLGLVIFQRSEPAALFTIATCAMWPTVLNTAVGVRNISADYLNVGRVLKLSRRKMFFSIILPATLPYVFTGYRLSLGIAWLVIVAGEMLTGSPGVGGFLWQEYNSLVYSHIILSILTIGFIGFLLDCLMGMIEAKFKSA